MNPCKHHGYRPQVPDPELFCFGRPRRFAKNIGVTTTTITVKRNITHARSTVAYLMLPFGNSRQRQRGRVEGRRVVPITSSALQPAHSRVTILVFRPAANSSKWHDTHREQGRAGQGRAEHGATKPEPGRPYRTRSQGNSFRKNTTSIRKRNTCMREGQARSRTLEVVVFIKHEKKKLGQTLHG